MLPSWTPAAFCRTHPGWLSCAGWTACSCTVWTAPTSGLTIGWAWPGPSGSITANTTASSSATAPIPWAYTAAALSYLIQDCPKPIVLTGAQKPIWFDGTDSKRNLIDAFLYACRGCGGVQIVFNGRVILGTRARKTFSKSFQAFSSVNYPELAMIQDERLLQYITTDSCPAPRFYDDLDGSVGPFEADPRHRRELLAFMADRYDGLVIEGFGVGGLPEYDGFYDVIRQAAESGKLVVMTTQVPNEGSDLTVYHVGGHLKHTLRVLEAYDMTTEAAVCKLMWILGQTHDFAQAEKLFYAPVSRDILRFSGE